MSRYDAAEYYEESFPNQSELWAANARRALKGKRGRKALADLRDALLALPEKRLINGALCTVGAAKRRPEPVESSWGNHDWHGVEFDEIVNSEGEGVREAKMTFSLAWELAYRNDETYGAKTPEQRYEAFLSWIDEELDEPIAVAATAEGER